MHFTLLVAGALLPGEARDCIAPPIECPPSETRRLSRRSRQSSAPHASRRPAPHTWTGSRRDCSVGAAPVPTAPYAYAHLAGKRPRPPTSGMLIPVHIEVARDQPARAVARTVMRSRQKKPDRCSRLPTSSRLLPTVISSRVGERLVSVVRVRMAHRRTAAICGDRRHGRGARWHVTHGSGIVCTTKSRSPGMRSRVNADREVQGVRTINALWLHGGGRWQAARANRVRASASRCSRVARRRAGGRRARLARERASSLTAALVVIDDCLGVEAAGGLGCMAASDDRRSIAN